MVAVFLCVSEGGALGLGGGGLLGGLGERALGRSLSHSLSHGLSPHGRPLGLSPGGLGGGLGGLQKPMSVMPRVVPPTSKTHA